ncbi:thioredoxin fold domain-containing protein [Ekhidna sp.]
MHHFLSFLLLTGSLLVSQAKTIPFQNITVKEALQRAQLENKFVFVDFYADWCKPCKLMEQEVFSNDSIGEFFDAHFISVRVDAENEQLSLVNSLGIEAYPTLTFYDPKGRLVYRAEGAIPPNHFYELANSLVHLNDYLKEYQKNDKRMENVRNYLLALSWINEHKARSLATKYLYDLKEKEYTEPENWQLIQRFLQSKDRILFQRVVNSEIVKSTFPTGRQQLLLNSFDNLLDLALEKGNSALLRRRTQYINRYGDFLKDPDSVLLIGNLQYSSKHNPDKYPEYISQYIEDYLPEDAEAFADISYDISQRYFQKSILEFAADLANRSIHLKPNLFAYLSLSSISEKLSQFKAAYGYLLLAYQYADKDQQRALDEQEKALKHKMEFELESGVNLIDELGDDGRFTLGAGSQRLMYGYPVPQSTSHFVVNVDGKLASNTPFAKDVEYLKGITDFDGSGITPKVVTTFQFGKVKIRQMLQPVDKDGNPISHGLAQYYQISYELKTDEVRTRNVGLSLLFDTMMDDNDACEIGANGTIIPYEYEFRGDHIPSELLFYHTPNDTSKLMGSALIAGWNATPPDKLVVGRWPYLHLVKWDYRLRKVKYGDSAYLLRWENQYLSSQRPITFTTYYGLPLWKKPELRIIMKDNKSVLNSTTEVYFENNKSELDLNAKMKIQELLENESISIVGVILRGYADVTGAKEYNFDLSKRRIETVGKIFKSNNIPFVPKPYGLEESENSYFNQVFGNAFDRKVSIVVYYRLKSDDSVVSTN